MKPDAVRRVERRRQLAESDRCRYCHRPVIKRSNRQRSATMDHVLPQSRGGRNEASNLLLACGACNEVKGDRTPEEWAADILAAARSRPAQPKRSDLGISLIDDSEWF